MSEAHWSHSAITDLDAIVDYYAGFSVELGARENEALVRAAYWLASRPFAGPTLDILEWRKWKPRKTGHGLIYRPTTDGIEVLRVRHERDDGKPRTE